MKSIKKAHRYAVLCAAVLLLFADSGIAQDQIPEPEPLQWGPPSIDEALSGKRAEDPRADDRSHDRDAQYADVEVTQDERSILRSQRRENDRPVYDRSDDRPNDTRTARRHSASQRRPSRGRPPAWSPARPGVRRPPWQGTLLPNPDPGFGNPPFVVIDRTGTKRRYIRQSPNIDLKRRLYRTAIVHDDTGLILSASQLDFPVTQRNESEDVGYADNRDGRGNEKRGAGYVEQAAYESNESYEFEDPDDDVYAGSYGRPYDEYDPVYTAQHFEELPPGALTGPPIIETGPADGGNYVLEGEGTALCGNPCGCQSCRGGGDLFGLGLGYGRLFGLWNRSGGGYLAGNCDPNSCCDGCATEPCGDFCNTECGGCTELPAFWVNADYFFWWTSGMYLPPLVTTGVDTNLLEAGRLGFPDTRILYGGQDVLTDLRDGGRLRGGFRIAPRFGIQADYFGLEQETNRYRASGTDGTPIITRPFFDIMRPTDSLIDDPANVLPAEGRERVSFPAFGGSPAISGTITVDTVADLESFGVTGRYGLCCEQLDCGDCLPGGVSRIDVLAGYRYMQLDEGLRIREDLIDANDNTFDVRDSFRTHNDFHGAEIGTVWGWEEERWSLELLTKLAVGSTRQLVVINGSTTFGGAAVLFPGPHTGGLLAQRTNIGSHKRHEFSMIPELSGTIAYRVTDRLRLTAGYTLIYWSRVARPGEHVDLDVNRNLIPDSSDDPNAPPPAVPGPLRPVFSWIDTDFWAQGVNAGVDYRW